MLPKRFHEADLAQKGDENRDPTKQVSARGVSRRINPSSDNRVSISRGTGLFVAFDSIPPIVFQILGCNRSNPTPCFPRIGKNGSHNQP